MRRLMRRLIIRLMMNILVAVGPYPVVCALCPGILYRQPGVTSDTSQIFTRFVFSRVPYFAKTADKKYHILLM